MCGKLPNGQGTGLLLGHFYHSAKNPGDSPDILKFIQLSLHEAVVLSSSVSHILINQEVIGLEV